MLISLIVPCYNEEEAMPLFYKEASRVAAEMKASHGAEFEFIFVDDGSRDGTLRVARELHAQDPRVRYVSFSRNFGKEAGIYAGLQAAKGDYVATMDADLQDPPALLPQMLDTLLTGEYDSHNALVSFHAGAGGTEAQDWCAMLYRMYTRWAERHGFTYKIMDYQDGDTAGIKSADILIEGENAYGFLKGENGVHRLVRISPFDASGRRQTSFSAVEVVPDIPDTSTDFEIKPDDYEMQVYRSSGAGGQHINKTSSAVRLIHKATGIVVACQTERSQLQNKENCLRMLRSKLVEIKEREHLEKISDIKGVQQKIEWGSQIRSYVFMPYTLAKDTRTGFENANINAVMDGDIDGFINAYLSALATGVWEGSKGGNM